MIKAYLYSLKSPALKTFLGQLKPFKKSISLCTLLSLISELICLVPALITGHIIDQYLTPQLTGPVDKAQKDILLLIAVLFISYLSAEFLKIIKTKLQISFTTDLGFNLSSTLYKHLLHLPFTHFDKIKTGNLLSRFSNDINHITNLAQNLILTPTTAFLRLAFIIIYALYINPLLSLILFTSLVGLTILCLFLSRKQRRIQKQLQGERAQLSGFMSEIFQGMRVVRSHVKEQSELENFTQRQASINKKQIDASIQQQKVSSLWTFIQGISTSIVLGVGSFFILKNEMTLGNLIIIQFYATQAINPIVKILTSITATQSGLSALERYQELLQIESEETLSSSSKTKITQINSLQIQNLSFSYEPHQEILSNISLNFKRGQVLALVGPSGSGKSTLADLICGFQQATSGHIFINDLAFKDIQKASYLENLAIVHQDSFVFDGTIKDNILYANDSLDDSSIVNLCHKARLGEFINSLEKGIHTRVGENGIRLSGGQKQRLCLARAFASQAEFIILDEATSHLDSRNEKLIQEAIFENKKDIITLIIAHNLSTIRDADQIIVLEQGKIVEQGTHEQLKMNKSTYCTLLNADESTL